MTPKNIAKVCETPTTKAPGAIDEIYWSAICEITGEGDVNAALADLDTFGQIVTAHTFTGTKGFIKISDIEPGTAEYEYDDQSEGGYGLFKVTAKAMGRTQNLKLTGMLNQEKYRDGIALIKLKNGNVMQIGTFAFPAHIKGSFKSGVNTSKEKFGTAITIEAEQPLVLSYNYPTLAITIIT